MGRQGRHGVMALEEGIDLVGRGVGIGRLEHGTQTEAESADAFDVGGAGGWKVLSPDAGGRIDDPLQVVDAGQVLGSRYPAVAVDDLDRQPNGVTGVIGEIHLTNYMSSVTVTSIGDYADYATGGVWR